MWGFGGRTPPTKWTVLAGAGLWDFEHDLTQSVAIYEHLSPAREALVILKHGYSRFHRTELDCVLRSLGVTTVTNGAPRRSSVAEARRVVGIRHGHKVLFCADVNLTDDPTTHEADLKTLRWGFTRVVPGVG